MGRRGLVSKNLDLLLSLPERIQSIAGEAMEDQRIRIRDRTLSGKDPDGRSFLPTKSGKPAKVVPGRILEKMSVSTSSSPFGVESSISVEGADGAIAGRQNSFRQFAAFGRDDVEEIKRKILRGVRGVD